MKFRKGLVVAAALGLAVLGSFGLKKVRKTADTSASTVNTVQESVVETSEQSTQATTEEVTAESLIADGIIRKANDGIVVIATGNLEKKLAVKAKRFTKAAKEKLEALGGKTEVI